MKPHHALNIAEIAELYYKKLGKFTTRRQASKNFLALKHPNRKILDEIEKEIKESNLFEFE